jgi:membrane associated rhomboid family serine protease
MVNCKIYNMNINLSSITHANDPVTLSLMFLIFVFGCYSFYSNRFFLKMLLHPYSIIKQKEYYRLITSDLVHNDFTHLLLNEVMIFTYCGRLEQFLNKRGNTGSEKFLLIYVVSCLTGAIIVSFRNYKDFGYSSAGASGSVFGCMFSYVILQPTVTAFYLPAVGAVNNLFFGLICILGFVVYQRKSNNTALNHEVHFFSALGGIAITLILFPSLIIK